MSEVEMQTTVQAITPYRAVQTLLEKALEQVIVANTAFETGDLEGGTLAVDSTAAIVAVLQDSLDKDQGGEIADNLDALYDYMTRRLAGAVQENDSASLAEVKDLLQSIKSAWDGIGAEIESV